MDEILLFNKFFLIVDAWQLRRYRPTTLCDGAADGEFLRTFCILYFQRVACTFRTCIVNCKGHIMCGSMVDIQSATDDNRRGKKERTRMWANAQRDGRPA